MKFRNDICGLRTIAVIPVLFFHAGVPWSMGGFLGVDVFFVLSGFLITSAIVNDVEKGDFSFYSFYDRRIRRILPAFLIVLLVTSILSFYFMVPYDLKNYGQSLFASIVSANNILLYLTSGYWSLAADFKPLYHTWSLAVEEQYYFFIPIFISTYYVIFKSTKRMELVFVFLIVSGFLLSLLIEDKELNFLMVFTRSWELICGSLLSFIVRRKFYKPNELLSLLGLFFIVLSYYKPYFFSINQAVVNLLPVLGTSMIIMFSSTKNTIVGKLLSLRSMVFIGMISYSIYLWHQPLLAFLRLSSESPLNYKVETLVSLISIPLAYVTWFFIEQPFRNPKRVKNKVFYSITIFLILSLGGLGLGMYKTYGFERFNQKYSYGGNPQSYVDNPRRYINNAFENNGNKKTLVMGNSFSRDFINMMEENDIIKNLDLVYFEGNCKIGNQNNLKKLIIESDFVIWAQDWGQLGFNPYDIDIINDCISDVKAYKNTSLFVLGSKNFGWNNNFVKTMEFSDAVFHRVKPLDSVVEFNCLAKKMVSTNYIDTLSLITLNDLVPVFTDRGKFITYDTNHLTKDGARYLGEKVFSETKLSFLKKL